MRNQLLETIKRTLIAIRDILPFIFQEPAYEQPPKDLPVNQDPPKVPKEVLLNGLIIAMRRHEGWFPGSRSQRNNNPLNTRYSSIGYLPKYEPVRRDAQNFAIFKDIETGTLYAKNLILEKARKHPDWNLYQFIGDEQEGWAPVSDGNDSPHYAATIAKEMKVDPYQFRLKDLL